MKNKVCVCLILVIALLTSCVQEEGINETDRGIDSEEINDKKFDSLIDENTSSIDIQATSDYVEPGYKVESNKYSYKNINVIYPSIEGLESSDNQKIINELLKDEALSFVTIMEDSKDVLNYELGYSVVFQDKNFMSVIFTGYRYMDDAPYPVDVFYSTNVDLHNAKKIVLGDMVLIDENFINLYVQYLGVDKGDEMNNFACEYLVNSLSTDNFKEGLAKADMLYGSSIYVYSYFTETNIGLSWEVPHSVGDHVEIEIPIEVLSNNIKEGVLDRY